MSTDPNQDAIDRMKASVAAQKTIKESVVTLLGSLSGRLRGAADDPAQVNALADELDANNAAFAAAVEANTV